MRPKKYFILLVLKILETESDCFCPLTQSYIAQCINAVYPCDRKTVGRNIAFLTSIGYPIVKTTRGFYMDKRMFLLDEINYIVKAIRVYNEKNDQEKEDIIVRLKKIMEKSLKYEE